MSARKIVIALHERDVRAIEQPYIIWLLRDAWRAQGIEVAVAWGIDRHLDADVVFPHIDLTVYPDDYVRFLAAYPRVINRDVVNISKGTLSRNLVGRDDDWNGPVIVKTNRNFGGLPEQKLHRNGRPLPGVTRLGEWFLRRIAPRRALANAVTMDPYDYPIFPSAGDVPDGVFTNRALVVERFLPEIDGGNYVLRNYVFLGDQHTNSRKLARGPIVKASRIVHREVVPVASGIVAERARLRFDYGKFDYVVRNGEAVLLDANRTPTYDAGRMTTERHRGMRMLAKGIAAYTA